MKMKNAFVALSISIIFIGVIWLGVLLLPAENTVSSADQEMLKITQEWARLESFPEDAKNFKIWSEGNSFTRTFKGQFNVEKEVLLTWVQNSSGLQDAKIVKMSDGQVKYIIKPGGGANYAEVIVNMKSCLVKFRASWS